MYKKNTRLLVITALFTAITIICTALLSLHILPNNGYIHFGDAIIILAASILPMPFAVFTGAVGGAAADILLGSSAWAPFTFLIKALIALCFSNKGEKLLTLKNILGFIPMTIITVGGYYLAEAILYGNWIAPFVNAAFGNLIQAVASAVIFSIFAAALDKLKFKSNINNLINK